MRIVANGSERELPDRSTLADVARVLGVGPDEPGVAAAVDGEVVPRASWRARALPDGARVEVVRAAAGG